MLLTPQCKTPYKPPVLSTLAGAKNNCLRSKQHSNRAAWRSNVLRLCGRNFVERGNRPRRWVDSECHARLAMIRLSAVEPQWVTGINLQLDRLESHCTGGGCSDCGGVEARK